MTNQERRDRSFSRIVEEAYSETFAYGDGLTDEMAAEILKRLHERGLAIHDTANCVRVPWQERAGRVQPGETLGRPMTEAEMAAVGLISDDVP